MNGLSKVIFAPNPMGKRTDILKSVRIALEEGVEWVKIGLALHWKYGSSLFEDVAGEGAKILYDAKFHDTRDTLEDFLRLIDDGEHGISAITVHNAQIDKLKKLNEMLKLANIKMYGVTILTDEIKECCAPSGRSWTTEFRMSISTIFESGAEQAIQPSFFLDVENPGISLPRNFVGVRPTWAGDDNHVAPKTPREVVRKYPDCKMIIGRPISDPPGDIGNQYAALRLIKEEIERAPEDF